jgi:O-antigen/teichoic acid export membrane protein
LDTSAERERQTPISRVLRSLLKDSSVYLVGSAIVGLSNVVLVPLYTRTLKPAEFGVYALIDVTVLLLVTATALKLDVSYLKWFADLDPAKHGELLGSTLLAGISVSAIGGGLLWAAVASPAGARFLQSANRDYAYLLLPIVVLENCHALLLTDLRARRRSGAYSTIAVVRVFALVIATYYLMVVRRNGLEGLFLGRLMADLAAVAVVSIICVRSVVWKFSRALLVPMLQFGMPLIWSVVLLMLQDASGRYALMHYGTLSDVGLLGAAIKIGGVFQLVLAAPFGVAWGGMLFQITKQRNAQIIYSKIFGYVYAAALASAMVLAVLAPTLMRVFTTPAYYGAVAVLPLVLLVRAANVIEQPSATALYLSGRTHLFAANYSAGFVLTLVLLRLLVPRMGIVGVGWAWMLGSALVPVLNLVVGQRYYRLSFDTKLIVFPLVPWIFVMLRLSGGDWIWTSLRFECALSAAIVLGLFLLVFYDLRSLREDLQKDDSHTGTLSGDETVEAEVR